MATATAAPTKQWAREYETIYILRPDVDNDAAEKVANRARDVVKRLDGTLTKLDNWGKRRLAYPIEKNNRGIFVYLKFVGFGGLVAELERNLRLLDEVVRFQTVLLQEDIDPAAVVVDEEELKYLHIEDQDEPEDMETERARSLGMIPRAPREEAPRPAAPADPSATPGDAAAAQAPGAAAATETTTATKETAEAAPEAPAAAEAAAPEAPAATEGAAPEAAPEATDTGDDKPEGGAK